MDDKTQIVKEVVDYLQTHPERALKVLKVSDLQSLQNLGIDGDVSFSKTVHFFDAGSSGAGTPPLINNWIGDGDNPPGYWKDPFGRVHLVGHIKDGLINEPFAVLPPGHWPAQREHLRTQSSYTLGRIDVWTNGNLVPMPPATNLGIILDGMVFRVKEGR